MDEQNVRSSTKPEIRGMFGEKGDSLDWLGECCDDNHTFDIINSTIQDVPRYSLTKYITNK